MDFASALQLLTDIHDREIEQRKFVEATILSLRKELEEFQKKGETISETALQILATTNMDIGLLQRETSAPTCGNGSSNGAFLSETRERAEGLNVSLTPTSLSSSPESPSADPLKKNNDELEELVMMKGWKKVQRSGKKRSHCSAQIAEMFSSSRDVVSLRPYQRTAIEIVESHAFENISACAIFLNSCFIGVVADFTAQNTSNGVHADIPFSIKLIERVFTFIFFMELALRLLEGPSLFFCGPNKSWNVFDLAVVAGDVSQAFVEIFFKESQVDLKMLRMLRIIRITRAFRVIRLVRFFKELRMMVFAIMRCGTSLLWAMLLFSIIMYVFGVFLMNSVTDSIGDGLSGHKLSELQEQFGTLPKTVYTMYACMSGGMDWTDAGNNLNELHWTNGVALAFYVFFTLFIVSNILTGIFVDTAIQSAVSDRDEIVQEQIDSKESELMMLKQAFEETDEDNSGTITTDEFKDHLANEQCRALFRVIGLEVHEAYGLFKLLDMDSSGEVSIEEFVMGCMRLKGEAKSIDLATLMYENKRLVERIRNLEKYCREQFETLKCNEELIEKSFVSFFGQQEVVLNEQFRRLASDGARKQSSGEKFKM